MPSPGARRNERKYATSGNSQLRMDACMSVSTTPGIALPTRTLGARSASKHRMSCSSAALLVQYSSQPRNAECAAPLLI